MFKTFYSLQLLIFTFLIYGLSAADFKPINDGLIHEAYLTQAKPDALLEALQETPPQPILEKIPPQNETQTIWIQGYFSWSDSLGDFIWVSGVWRKPPPGHQWIKGFWKNYDDGWVWIPGFWSPVSEYGLTYIDNSPPHPIDESVSTPQNNNFFWDPGYWLYNNEISKYEWVSGRWLQFDQNWILVPAHYIWRPQGYVFIPSYWDWPINQLGSAYTNVYIDPDVRLDYVYVHEQILEEVTIIEKYLPYYPDYICYFQYHLHHNPEFWVEYCCTPPWWAWETWWSFNWHDQWALWWWYTHPGFPQPQWMNAKIANHIPRPTGRTYRLFKNTRPPAIITRRGITTIDDLEQSIKNVTRQSRPILPFNKFRRNQIIDQTTIERPTPRIRPTGKRKNFNPRIHSKDQPSKPSYVPREQILRAKNRPIPPLPDRKELDSKKTPPSRPKRMPGRGEQRTPAYTQNKSKLKRTPSFPNRRTKREMQWPDTRSPQLKQYTPLPEKSLQQRDRQLQNGFTNNKKRKLEAPEIPPKTNQRRPRKQIAFQNKKSNLNIRKRETNQIRNNQETEDSKYNISQHGTRSGGIPRGRAFKSPQGKNTSRSTQPPPYTPSDIQNEPTPPNFDNSPPLRKRKRVSTRPSEPLDFRHEARPTSQPQPKINRTSTTFIKEKAEKLSHKNGRHKQ